MTAVLGGDRDEVLATLDKHGLTPANDNGPGQIVAAGTLEQLEAFAAEPPAKARLIPLSVAGAFHTEHMAPRRRPPRVAGRVGLDRHARDRRHLQQGRRAWSATASEVLARIVGQIANPVRWDLCMETHARARRHRACSSCRPPAP